MPRWTLLSRAERGGVILSGAWTTSTCYKPREIERPELGGALSQRRGDRDGFCRVDGHRSGQQMLLQETTDAMVQRRCPFVVTDARVDAQRGAGRHFQALVSGHGP